MLDLVLAIAHHLAVFTLAGVLAAEFALVRPGLAGATIRQLAGLDAAYGAIALLVIAIGVLRVFFGASGVEFYLSNHSFWGKMAAFIAVGLLSIPPTLKFRSWAKSLASEPSFVPSAGDLTTARRFVHLQAGVFVLVLIFAAAMARGYGVT
ncbi:DUF2214 family protein [Devosia sp. RR2S18]|uniref:DUF2214 family protein n=1 Tax=Devosia rhizosphaerae TaxID=3049774 RepID=UPI0025402693|nr:DUF2214 family protein [Devosia sp. RR2S18]WIJ25371.1 DUF2214 family protein [Devosia sp. RR2S18]